MGNKRRVGAGSRGEGVEGGTLGGFLTSVSEKFATLPRLGGCTALRGGAHRAAHKINEISSEACAPIHFQRRLLSTIRQPIRRIRHSALFHIYANIFHAICL